MTGNFSILVVDDDDLFRQTLVAMIQTRHTEVLEANSAERGLELYHERQPALVFIDVNLPRMSGIEFVRLVGKDNPRVLVAVITGRPDKATIIDAFKAGASDFLLKPIERAELDGVLLRSKNLLARRENKLFRPTLVDELKLELKLPANIRSVSPAVSLILSHLEGLSSYSDMLRFELAIHEAVRNAFEHGCLEIGSEEKERLCEAGTFEKVLEQRSEEAERAGKKVSIVVEISRNTFSCTITDDGPGFDWRQSQSRTAVGDQELSISGRGLFLIRQFFDTVEYNEKGNSVRLAKKLHERNG